MKKILLFFLVIITFPLASMAAPVFGSCAGTGGTPAGYSAPGYDPATDTTYITCSVGAQRSISVDGSNGVLPCAQIDSDSKTIIAVTGVDQNIIPEVCPPAGIPGICAPRVFAAGPHGIAPNAPGILEVGAELINGVFESINVVVIDIGQTVYQNIVNNADYILSLNALTAVYIAAYGAMIAFGLASAQPAEIINRLLKVGLIYTLLSPATGWTFFEEYVATPVLGTMNDIITIFMAEPNSHTGAMTPGTPATETALTPLSVITLAQPMDLIFSKAFSIIVLGHIFLGAFGWFFSLVFLWCAIEIFLMMVGAIITYIKSIVGLLFLFSLAPILIPFSLFEQTRRVFYGWVALVFGFFLEPVMLFAFLGFFLFILNDQLLNTMYPGIGTPSASDFCWVQWFDLGPFKMWWWRPVRFFAANVTDINASGNYPHGTWHGSTPTNFSELLYLLFLVHVGKAIIKFIGHLSHDISGGQGPGIVRSNDVGRWFSNSLFSGRRPGEMAADLGKWGAFRSKNAYDRITGRRSGMEERSYGESSNKNSGGGGNDTPFDDAGGSNRNGGGGGKGGGGGAGAGGAGGGGKGGGGGGAGGGGKGGGGAGGGAGGGGNHNPFADAASKGGAPETLGRSALAGGALLGAGGALLDDAAASKQTSSKEPPGKAQQAAGQVVEKTGEVAEKSGKVIKGSGQAVKAAGKGVEATGKVVEKTGEAIELTGKYTAKAGQAVKDGLGTAGPVGKVVGTIVGEAITITGVAIEGAGKAVELAGKGVETAGKGIEKTGQVMQKGGEIVEKDGAVAKNAGKAIKEGETTDDEVGIGLESTKTSFNPLDPNDPNNPLNPNRKKK